MERYLLDYNLHLRCQNKLHEAAHQYIDTDMYFSVVLSDQEVDELINFLQHKKEIMEIGNE